MLIVGFNNFPDLEWKIKESGIPLRSIVGSQINDVKYIYASGEESTHIFKKYGGNTNINRQPTIPFTFGYITDGQWWYGDIAKTILANL